MNNIVKLTMALALVISFASCGDGKKEKRSELNDKKAELQKLKGEQQKLSDQINKLQDELAVLDPATVKAKLVTIEKIGVDDFSHYIDLQGRVDAQNTAMVAPTSQGGVVRSIHVRQGQPVRKGQLILKLDNTLGRQQVVQARQQISGLEADLKLKQSLYQRQQNLWKNNIGTEVQVMQAKTAVDAASSALRAARASVSLAEESAGQANVYASISGTIDVVNVKVGEFFSPQTAAMPTSGIRIVNTGDLKVLVNVPENYSGKVNTGSNLRVTLPETGKVIDTKASVVSKLIDPASRTFFVEGRLPQDKDIKANQIARVQIMDYNRADAITIPVNTLQTDDKGKYVLVAVNENGKMVARKKNIIVGELYGDRLEVKSGLASGDQIITEGFQSLYEGQIITTTTTG